MTDDSVAMPWRRGREMDGVLMANSAVRLLLLVPTLVTLQVYDRVPSSRRSETLFMLLTAALVSLAAWCHTETSRLRWQTARAATWEAQWRRVLLPRWLEAPSGTSAGMLQQGLRDLATVRAFAGGPAFLAWVDLPWCLVYLLVLSAFHPRLGGIAGVGMLALAALAWATEWRLRSKAKLAERAQHHAQRRLADVACQLDVLRAHGRQSQAVAGFDAVRSVAGHAHLAAELPGLSMKTFGKTIRQVLQLAMLACAAWLVMAGQATSGVMIAGSILLGKALMPLEVLIGGWKQQLEVRRAITRLRQLRGLQVQPDDQPRQSPSLPRFSALYASNLCHAPSAGQPSIFEGVSFSLPAGALLAVVGPSGSGKSMLARVIAGVLPATKGELSLGGMPLYPLSAEERGCFTGYLPQDGQLHGGSIGKNTREPRVADGARRAQALRTPRGGAALDGGTDPGSGRRRACDARHAGRIKAP